MKATSHYVWGKRGWLLVVLLGCVMCPESARAQTGLERLRAAWIKHRLEGAGPAAQPLYLSLYNDAELAPDVRCRAAIGLGIVAREQSALGEAREWFLRASNVSQASGRWVRSARRLLLVIADTIESERDPQRSVDDFQREIDALKRDRTRFSSLIGERDVELQRKDELIARLRIRLDSARKADELQAEARHERASGVLMQIVEQERDAERLKRYLINQGIQRCQRHLDEGRWLHATNEIKRVLEIDSQHAEARRLLQHCQSTLARASGQQAFRGEGAGAELQPKVSRRLVVDVMAAYLTEARRLYRAGRVGGAIAAYERVLSEYAVSPVPLSQDEVNTLVAPAEFGLRRCFEELGVAGNADLPGERSHLLSALRKDAHRLLEQQQALEKAESDVEEIKSQNPEEGLQRARQEIDRSLLKAEESLAQGKRTDAADALRDVLTLLEWFPTLDPEGALSRRVAGELDTLTAGGEQE
ncbi:MAG: hypothetical protein AAF581_22355 [Planctomycetota bacterium]